MVRTVRKRELLHVFRFGTGAVEQSDPRRQVVRKRELLHVFLTESAWHKRFETVKAVNEREQFLVHRLGTGGVVLQRPP